MKRKVYPKEGPDENKINRPPAKKKDCSECMPFKEEACSRYLREDRPRRSNERPCGRVGQKTALKNLGGEKLAGMGWGVVGGKKAEEATRGSEKIKPEYHAKALLKKSTFEQKKGPKIQVFESRGRHEWRGCEIFDGLC